MQNAFEALIDGYVAHGLGVADGFLAPQLASGLAANLQRYHLADNMRAAGTGNGGPSASAGFRGDEIHWLDRRHEDPHERAFFDRMDDFVNHLNETCYTGIGDYEFHYTRYAAGTCYQRHRDRFRSDDSRQFSMILYLNENWVEADGGALCVYPDGQQPQRIEPRNGRSVFFKSSDLEHEVLPVHKERISITGWLKY